MSVTLSQPLSFLRVPQDVVEYNIAPFLEGEDCLALSLVCKESSKMDKIWSTLAQKWKPKAFAYFRHNHPLSALVDECFPDFALSKKSFVTEKRAITYLILDYADMPTKLGRKMICRLGVHAELFENFPPEFLTQLLGSVSAFYNLPKMAPRPLIEDLPDLYVQERAAADATAAPLWKQHPHQDLATLAQCLFVQSMWAYERAILPCQLIDKKGNRHPVMRCLKKSTEDTIDQVIAFTHCTKTDSTPPEREYRVYDFRRHLKSPKKIERYYCRAKPDYKPAEMLKCFQFTKGPAELRTETQRRFEKTGGFESFENYEKYLKDPSGLSSAIILREIKPTIHDASVYEPFVPKTREESKEGKKE